MSCDFSKHSFGNQHFTNNKKRGLHTKNMNCEMCGKEAELFKANIEGVVLTVCEKCGKFGKVISRVTKEVSPSKVKSANILLQKKVEIMQVIVENYAELIKRKREKMGLTQRDFSMKFSEKESLMHKIESGDIKPNLELAKKLEKLLGLKLVEQREDETGYKTQTKTDELTLGDFVKVRKR